MFKSRSKVLFLVILLGAIYAIYLYSRFFIFRFNSNSIEELGFHFMKAVIMPHFLGVILSSIITLLGFYLRNTKITLFACIFFGLSLILMPHYFMYTLVLFVLVIVGHTKQKKINRGKTNPHPII